MKILLLGDASNYHNALATGLRQLGHDVTLASDGSKFMDTRRDIDLSRKPGRLGGAKLWWKLSTSLAPKLKGYDVVQLASTSFVQLRPSRLIKLFRRLKKNNGAVYLTALGTDSAVVRNLTSANPALAYSEWHNKKGLRKWATTPLAEKEAWLAPELVAYTDEIYRNVDGVVSALYEYHRIVEAEYPDVPLAYGGIPVDMASLGKPVSHDFSKPLRVLYASKKDHEMEKGADTLLMLLQMVSVTGGTGAEIVRVKNVPYDDFLDSLRSCSMVSDQMYAYTPATTALMAMALGIIPISGGDEEFYRFIGEDKLRPVFATSADDVRGTYNRLHALMTNPAEMARMSAEGPEFVRKHNDAKVVAQRFVDFWTKTKTGNR